MPTPGANARFCPSVSLRRQGPTRPRCARNLSHFGSMARREVGMTCRQFAHQTARTGQTRRMSIAGVITCSHFPHPGFSPRIRHAVDTDPDRVALSHRRPQAAVVAFRLVVSGAGHRDRRLAARFRLRTCRPLVAAGVTSILNSLPAGPAGPRPSRSVRSISVEPTDPGRPKPSSGRRRLLSAGRGQTCPLGPHFRRA